MRKPTPKSFFKGQRAPAIDFDEVRDGIRAQPLFIDVDLSIARTINSAPFPISGNTLFIDQKSNSGSAQLVFQEQLPSRPCAITVFPGFVARVPFTQLTVVNVAQPGQVLRIIYGTDLDFVPTISAGVVIVNVPLLTLADDSGYTAGVSFVSNALLTTLTPQNVIAAASNLNGLLVHHAAFIGGDNAIVGAHTQSLLAKATAPTGTADGFAVMTSSNAFMMGTPGIIGTAADIERAVNVPAGLRLDFIDQSTQNWCFLRHVNYTIK